MEVDHIILTQILVILLLNHFWISLYHEGRIVSTGRFCVSLMHHIELASLVEKHFTNQIIQCSHLVHQSHVFLHHWSPAHRYLICGFSIDLKSLCSPDHEVQQKADGISVEINSTFIILLDMFYVCFLQNTGPTDTSGGGVHLVETGSKLHQSRTQCGVTEPSYLLHRLISNTTSKTGPFNVKWNFEAL